MLTCWIHDLRGTQNGVKHFIIVLFLRNSVWQGGFWHTESNILNYCILCFACGFFMGKELVLVPLKKTQGT